MRRRDFIVLVGGAAAAWPHAAAAQPRGKVVRIGLLSTSFLQRTAGVEAFKERLKQLGYRKSVEFDPRRTFVAR